MEDVSVLVVLDLYDAIVDAVTQVTAGEPVSVKGQKGFATLRDRLLPSLKKPSDSNLLAAAAGVSSHKG